MPEPKTIIIENVIPKGAIPWFAIPGGPQPRTKITIEFPISLDDYLLLTASAEAGYTVTITPIKQPLPEEDSTLIQWQIPGLNVEGVADDHEHVFREVENMKEKQCNCGAFEDPDNLDPQTTHTHCYIVQEDGPSDAPGVCGECGHIQVTDEDGPDLDRPKNPKSPKK